MSSSKENCQTDQHQTCPREAAAGPQGAQLEKYEFVKIKIGSRLVEESPVTKYEFVKLEHNGGGIALCNRPFLKIFCRQGSRRKILTKGMKTCSTIPWTAMISYALGLFAANYLSTYWFQATRIWHVKTWFCRDLLQIICMANGSSPDCLHTQNKGGLVCFNFG